MKTKIFQQILFGMVLINLSVFNHACSQSSEGVFYSVTGNGIKDTSWLFGTYHLINESYLTETPNVLQAFKNSKNLVVEVVVDSSQLASANAKALLQNKQLSGLLNKSFADSLDAELKATIGQGIEQLQTLKPMTVMLTLSMVYLMKDNQALLAKYSGAPLDAAFAANAKMMGKNVTSLETIDQQMDLLFNTLSEEEQVNMLKQFIRNKDRNIKISNELLQVYFDNDIEKIYGLYQASVKETGDMDFLIRTRNENWMTTLPGLIKKQSQFIAVGALHLAGPDGLVEQLRKKGFTVKTQKLK